MLDIQTGMIY